MIRSSKHTLRFTNCGKRDRIKTILVEYRRLLQVIIDEIWKNGLPGHPFDPRSATLELPKLAPHPFVKSLDSWFSARMKQACCKQALGMILAVTKKQSQRYFILARLQRAGKDHESLQRKIDITPLVKPRARYANMELDSRFVDFREAEGTFDLYVRLTSIGDRITIKVPLKHTRVSRKWEAAGTRKKSIRVSDRYICLIYEADNAPKHCGVIVGCDQGYLTALTLSDAQTTDRDRHGHDLVSIQARLARRCSGSKSFRRSQQHRANYINWALKNLDWSSISEARLERIYQLRKNKKQHNKTLIHWAYPLIRKKLEALAETEGFVLVEVPNEFRSQRCSHCGWVRKANRKGKTFRCGSCDFVEDADLNAATNLKLDLFEVPYWVRRKKLNRVGFYWNRDGIFSSDHEPIVRDTTEPVAEEISA